MKNELHAQAVRRTYHALTLSLAAVVLTGLLLLLRALQIPPAWLLLVIVPQLILVGLAVRDLLQVRAYRRSAAR